VEGHEYSLRGRVFHTIREDILSGKYEKGEELKEIAIGNELGVSRTPVREALRQLEGDIAPDFAKFTRIETYDKDMKVYR